MDRIYNIYIVYIVHIVYRSRSLVGQTSALKNVLLLSHGLADLI